jgi:hypothetical protein
VAEPTPAPRETPDAEPGAAPGRRTSSQSRRARDRGRTPLFDQYAEEDRPRAANE